MVVAMVIATTVGADMVRPSDLDAGSPAPVTMADRQGRDAAPFLDSLLGFDPIDLDGPSIAFLPLAGRDAASPTETQQSLHLLTDDHGSLDLCLYALLGLGLCRSAPWVRKLSVSHVLEWRHAGGCQIDAGLMEEPDWRFTTPFCLVQPRHKTDSALAPYRQKIVVSLWRQSQFTPALLAPRGPPLPRADNQPDGLTARGAIQMPLLPAALGLSTAGRTRRRCVPTPPAIRREVRGAESDSRGVGETPRRIAIHPAHHLDDGPSLYSSSLWRMEQ